MNAPLKPGSLVRLKQILELVPISRSTWWVGVQTGRYPKPVKLGPNTTVWKADDIISLLQRIGGATA